MIYLNNHSKYLRSRWLQAFTLIEVLGAIMILAIALVPVIGLIQSTLIISQKQEWETKTLYYAQQKMEEELELLSDDFLRPVFSGGIVEGEDNYRFAIQYSQDGSIPLNSLKIVTVVVWYDEDSSGYPVDAGETNVILNTKIANK